jgi:hypothetical protein
MIRPRHFGWIVLFTTLAGCATVAQKSGGADATYESEVSAGLEEIFVTRTTRTQFVPGATPACAATPFTSGFLTASTLAPTGGKDAVNVRGYLSTSVITMRFWRKPT